MAVKKKSAGKKKGPAKKKAVAKKRPAPKKAAKKPAKKKAAVAKKKPVAKAAPKGPPTRPMAKPVPQPAVAKPTPIVPAAPAEGGISAADVNLGHVVALRPRTHTGFKAEAFQEAKRALADARFATIEEAARAVAEKAVELSNESGPDPFSSH